VFPLSDGQPYVGIPAVAEADPDAFGLCLTTPGGSSYEVGASREKFTIQSLPKPLTCGLALTERGQEVVATKIDMEGCGAAFSEISLPA
jgi:glutaminase